jgi:hypothetical protein
MLDQVVIPNFVGQVQSIGPWLAGALVLAIVVTLAANNWPYA